MPTVIKEGSTFKMWYLGENGFTYATATDPTSWTVHPDSPVMISAAGKWDNEIYAPYVLRTDSLYQMWYMGRSVSDRWQTGYATSPDGINWTKHPDNPVLKIGTPNEWDSYAALASSVLYDDGLYHMWYQGGSVSSGGVAYATSADGVAWTKHADNPILNQGPRSWDRNQTWFPKVMKDGDLYRMWYSGRDASGTDRIGYAVDSTGVISTVQSLKSQPEQFMLMQNYPNPFNPSTSIEFHLPANKFVKLSVYDLNGREVTTLVNEQLNAGLHHITFDGTELSSGIYFYRLQAGDHLLTRKLTLVK
jgi:hypothetical protein